MVLAESTAPVETHGCAQEGRAVLSSRGRRTLEGVYVATRVTGIGDHPVMVLWLVVRGEIQFVSEVIARP